MWEVIWSWWVNIVKSNNHALPIAIIIVLFINNDKFIEIGIGGNSFSENLKFSILLNNVIWNIIVAFELRDYSVCLIKLGWEWIYCKANSINNFNYTFKILAILLELKTNNI